MMNHEGGEGRRNRWCEMSRGKRIAAMVAGALVFIPVLLALFGFGTMWLWNWLMPTIFKLPTIGFWQAVGILLLAQILFKGGHAGRMGRSRWKKERIRDRMREEGSPFAQDVQGKEGKAE